MMRRQRRWQAYSGYGAEELCNWLAKKAQEHGVLEQRSSLAARPMYSSRPGSRLELRHGARIDVVPVDGDPVYRAASRLVSHGRGSVSLVVVYAPDPSFRFVRSIMREAVRAFSEPPIWSVDAHPQLARAPWIRWQTRRRWLRWVQDLPERNVGALG